MKKSLYIYIMNSIRKKRFYIDCLSLLFSLTIIILTLIAFFGKKYHLFKAEFILAVLICGMNTYKGFKEKTPTRYIYAGFLILSLIAMVYSFIRL